MGVQARYLSGELACLDDSDCFTINATKVTLARLNDKFVSEIALFDEQGAELEDNAEVPSHLSVIIKAAERYDAGFWDTAIVSHAREGDVAGIERAKARLQSDSRGRRNGAAFCTRLLFESLRCDNPNADVVRALLASKADVNYDDMLDEHGTLLHIATYRKSPAEVFEAILASGASVNHVNRQRRTALLAAIEYDHMDVLQILIDSNADVNLASEDYRPHFPFQRGYRMTPLIFAIKMYNAEAVKRLIAASAQVDYDSRDGTALTLAIRLSTAPVGGEKLGIVVDILIEARADVNRETASGSTPLIEAATYGSTDQVAALLAAKAQVGDVTKGGKTALQGAFGRRDRQQEAIQLLMTNGAAESDINPSSCSGGTPALGLSAETIQALILAQSGAVCDNTCAPLVEAIVAGSPVEAIQALIDAQADVNLERNGTTVLMDAIERNAPNAEEVVRVLCDAGANVNYQYDDGYSLLMVTTRAGFRRLIVRALLEARADVNWETPDGTTPLTTVLQFQPQAAELFIEFGAYINYANKDGITPFLFGCRFALTHTDNFVSALVRANADVEYENKDGTNARASADRMEERCRRAAQNPQFARAPALVRDETERLIAAFALRNQEREM